MSLLLYINGQLMDLEPSQYIAQTRQVNDLNSLDDRQAGYTNKFKLPKTAGNIRALSHMALTGNSSNVPYQKNVCSLYSDSGECFVYNGWAIVTDGGSYYNAVVYDGVIDLYKDIENTTLAELDLSELTHTKDLDTIIQSWTQDKKYRYIVADYNGMMNPQHEPNNPIPLLQTDYLVPAVNVAYLWDRIFTKYEFGYSGSVFETEDFKNLWMTYPKGVSTEDSNVTVFESSDWNKDFGSWFNVFYPMKFNIGDNTEINGEVAQLINGCHIKVSQAGRYRIEAEGVITIDKSPGFWVYKNIHNLVNSPLATNSFENQRFLELNGHLNSDTPFHYSKAFTLQAGDTICLAFNRVNGFVNFNDGTDVTVRLIKVPGNEIDFTTALAGFSTTDFLKEIVNRFGLTLFKHKHENSYEFLTLKEQLESAESEDWTDKFAKKINEAYIYGKYAKHNWLRYNYNDKEATHNDGYIVVNNENLPESRDVIKSKIYSPENVQGRLLNRTVNIYKLWDKEIVEDPEEGEPPVTYKSLDKRFYFLRATRINQNIHVRSATSQEEMPVSFYYAESFSGLPFSAIVNSYYAPLQSILDKALIVNAEFYLKDSDIANFDFRKLYYIAPLSGYFLMNKISNYIPGKLTKCELVKVNHTPPQTFPVQFPWQIVRNVTINDVTRITPLSYNIRFETNFRPQYNLIFQYSGDNVTWQTAHPALQSWPQHITTNSPANYFRMYYASEKLYSNTFQLQP